jgi:hypothetical protein
MKKIITSATPIQLAAHALVFGGFHRSPVLTVALGALVFLGGIGLVQAADPLVVDKGKVTINGSLEVNGPLTVTGKTTTIEKALNVTGETTLAATEIKETLNVTGETTTIEKALNVTGTTNLAATTINKTLNVTGETTLAATEIKETLKVTGKTNLADTTIKTLTVGKTVLKGTALDGIQALDVEGPVIQKMDVISIGRINPSLAFHQPKHPVLNYFEHHLRGKPRGTSLKAITNNPNWVGGYFEGWVAFDGKIKVLYSAVPAGVASID